VFETTNWFENVGNFVLKMRLGTNGPNLGLLGGKILSELSFLPSYFRTFLPGELGRASSLTVARLRLKCHFSLTCFRRLSPSEP
jgi:hypothetical protein